MEVELDSTLLRTAPVEHLAILAICAFGLSSRHRVLPDDRVAWNAWANTMPVDLREELQLTWDESERRAIAGGPSEEIAVRPRVAPAYGASPMVLNPNEALSLLGRPLRVILENGRYDRGFLLAFASDAQRRSLNEAEREGWLIFETGGGIGELIVRSKAAVEDDEPRDVMRTMYLCDSDATMPWALSQQATEVWQNIQELEQRFRRTTPYFGGVLKRRAAENYAPPGAVLRWAASKFGRGAWEIIQAANTLEGRRSLAIGPGNAGSERRHLLAAIALKELHQTSQSVFDMKNGREKDGKVRTADAVWNRLDDFQKAALRDGFGAGFSGDFYKEARNITDETGEVSRLLAMITERV